MQFLQEFEQFADTPRNHLQQVSSREVIVLRQARRFLAPNEHYLVLVIV